MKPIYCGSMVVVFQNLDDEKFFFSLIFFSFAVPASSRKCIDTVDVLGHNITDAS